MKKFVIVGNGGRSGMYVNALCREYRKENKLVALCDTNFSRMNYWQDYIVKEGCPAPNLYHASEFDRMIETEKPDKVIVCSVDRTHHKYICRAMELGCDVISEKPMTVDAAKCQQIIDTKKRTGRELTVTFNYRYSPRNTKVKELLASGIAGEITSATFEWLLDTSHGADYFRRWHRDKRNSGGLLVHKSTHHFDLMNWWLDSTPETVFAMGDLKFYGKENAEKRGVTQFYARSRGSEIAAEDPFGFKVIESDEALMALYFNAEHEDGYYRDQSVFSDGISIEDNMNVMIRYANGVTMNYTLCAHCPKEGYRVCFNGTKGRLEFTVVEKSFVDGGHEDFNQPGMREIGEEDSGVPEITFQPLWGKPRVITYEENDKAGHGGGDKRMLKDIFVGVEDDPLGHAANYIDGAKSILSGIAANKSIASGNPVKVADLVKF